MSPTKSLELITRGPQPGPGRPPVLLVHGVRHAAWCWEPWQAGLAELGWGSTAMSLRGHGASQGSTRGATLKKYVDDVLTVTHTFDEPPILVGHSMGGLLVQRAALRTPIAGLALVAPAPAHNGLPFAVRFARLHPLPLAKVLAGRPLPFTREDLFSAAVSDAVSESVMSRLSPESAIAQYQFTFPRRAPERANCSVLVLASPDDKVIPAVDIARTGRLQGVEPHWFDGLGHDLMIEPDPGPFEAFTAWLDALPGTSTPKK